MALTSEGIFQHAAKTSSTVEIVNITPRRRWSVGEKVRLIEASMAPGQSVSLVARTYGVAPNLLYRWRKQMSEGGKTAIEANDEVVSVAEVKALRMLSPREFIRSLQNSECPV